MNVEEWAGHAIWQSIRADFIDWLHENEVVESTDPWKVFNKFAIFVRQQERQRAGVTHVTRKPVDRRRRRA